MSTETNSTINGDLTLVVTDDVGVQRTQVIAAWNAYVERHDLAGKLVVMARKLGGAIDRLQRREGWDAGLTMLAMDYLVGGVAEQVYSAAIALQTEEDGGGMEMGTVPSLVGVGEASAKERGDRLLAAAAAFSQELKLLGKAAAVVTMDVEPEGESLGFIGCNGIGAAAGALLLARYLEMKASPMAEIVYSHVVVSGSGEIQ